MKIGISGAANCGKSTIAKKIARDLNLPIIDERLNIIQERLRNESSPQKNLDTFLSILEEKNQSEEKNTSGFVADRTPIDLFVLFCAQPQQLLNTMPSGKVNEFLRKARTYCKKYDYIIIPPWGVVSYSELESWKAGFSYPRMNPWTNYVRHMSFLGTACMWVPQCKVLQPPASVVLEGRVTDWFLTTTLKQRKDDRQ